MSDDIISVYTRTQAVEDGTLIRVPTSVLSKMGIKADTCLTSGLHALLNDDDLEVESLRTLSLLSAFRRAVKDVDDSFHEFTTIIAGTSVKVWATMDPDGVTLMRPEDY